jgi:uncharacterized LabA/DUF88 family protein
MTEPGTPRVAVYLDFDNIVISRYDQVHGRNAFQKDKTAGFHKQPGRLTEATVDVGAIIDFASSFGTLVLTKAYADWSADVNADYRGQLVGRAVDLVQLFPAAAYAKNGADIRLAVDAVEDMFRLPDLTHVVIVAGDSDYIALAQRCKRLGRFVVGIGVPGGTSRALISACDEFEYYDEVVRADDESVDESDEVDDLDGVEGTAAPTVVPEVDGAPVAVARQAVPLDEAAPDEPARSDTSSAPTGQPIGGPGATRLLVKALGLAGKDADGWSQASTVKQQMKRLNPQYNEAALGFATFTDFVRTRQGQVELREDGQSRWLRLRATKPKRG